MEKNKFMDSPRTIGIQNLTVILPEMTVRLDVCYWLNQRTNTSVAHL